MSRTINITNFGNGVADDYSNGGLGEFSVSKHFDILTYPNRLQPLRGMTTTGEPTNSALGNMILALNGGFYGIGVQPASPTLGELWKKTGFGATSYWQEFNTIQSSGQAVAYDFLVDFPEANGGSQPKTMYWAAGQGGGAGILLASNPSDGSSISSSSLPFTTIGQGLVHPKNHKLYFPYQDTSSPTIPYIGRISAHASDAFGSISLTLFQGIPKRYRVYCLSHYGDYLAIPMTTIYGGSADSSVVGLWDKDESLTTDFNSTIPWGTGRLKILNNLSGILIGISEVGTGDSATTQDIDAISIKIYEGGSEPREIKLLTVQRLTTTNVSAIINTNVNFIKNNRLYFSINLVGGGNDQYGLWSVGKNRNGRWTVFRERIATDDNSETGIIAAAIRGDYVTTVHTAIGTITRTVNGTSLSSIFSATSSYESCVNPEMPEIDRPRIKKLVSVYATYLPLPVAGQVIMEQRKESSANGAWTTIFTETTDGRVLTEASANADGSQFDDGVNWEFRLKSTGGAIITGYGYKYEVVKSQQ